MYRKKHPDDCIAKFMDTVGHGAQAYSEKMADGPVFSTSIQFPDGNCDPLSDWDTQAVICVLFCQDSPGPITDVLEGLPGHTDILHELLRAKIRNNCVLLLYALKRLLQRLNSFLH